VRHVIDAWIRGERVFELRLWVRRVVVIPALAAVAVLTGCQKSGVRFTNVSDTWLNISFYVGGSEIPSDEPDDMYRRKTFMVEPGETVRYKPSGRLVHVQVETATPTWVPTGRQLWLELLTTPPIHVVANGRADKLDFQSFHGEIALIPQRELDAGRYVYHQTVKPEPVPTQPDPTRVTDAPTEPPDWN
jgi:hypothetical protein